MPDPEHTPGRKQMGGSLESFWIDRFESSAGRETDAARNIGHSFGHRERRAVFRDLVARHLPREARTVLDVGCGSGTYFDLYAQLGLRLQGLDFSPAQLAIAQQRWPEARLFAGELASAPRDLTADLVVCIGVVQIVTDLPAFFHGIAGRLNPGGLAIISCLEKRSIWPGRILDPHLRFYGLARMRALLGPHFVEREVRRFYPLPPPFHLVRPLLYRWQTPWLNHGLMFALGPKST